MRTKTDERRKKTENGNRAAGTKEKTHENIKTNDPITQINSTYLYGAY